MAFATYRDIVSGSSGSSKGSKLASYQDIKKSITPAQFEESRKKLREANDRNLQIDRQKKQEEILKKSQMEAEKYLQDFNDASSGFGGSILKRFGIGSPAPTLVSSPVTETPAYQQSQQIGYENTANLGKTVGANIKEAAKSLFTENTTNTIYDTIFQSGVDKQNLDAIENNTKKIVELHNKKKISTDPVETKKIDTAIGFLLEQNRQVAEQVGGEIEDKTNLQFIGQSVGTAMELLPLGVGSGMTQAGKLILEAGTKQALKSLGKEAALYGATVSSAGTAQEKDATIGDVIKSGSIGAATGVATIAIPGLAKWAVKDGGKYIQNLFKKISTEGTQNLSKEESLALKEIVSSKESTKTAETSSEIPEQKQAESIQRYMAINEKFTPEQTATPESSLIAKARKYNTPEEFVKAETGKYQPPEFFAKEEAARRAEPPMPLSEIDNAKIINDGYSNLPNETRAKIISTLDNSSVKEIKVYRATTGNELLPGDYVALDKSHAEKYAARHGGNVIEQTISKNDLAFNQRAGDFQYSPNGVHSLTDLWKKANEGIAISRGNVEKIDTSLPEQPKADTTQKKESIYAKSLEEKAVEKKMASEFQDLAEYTPAVRKEQAQMTTKLINEDIEKVNNILDGKSELPSGMRGSSLALAVEQHAIANGDVKLLQKLAKSKISTGISEAGSELSMLAGRNANSPVRIIRNIIKARKENAIKRLKGKKISEARKQTKESIKKAIQKEAPTKETWASFIHEIKC